MGVFVKICGCASGPDVEAIVALKPDALGFILWPGSPRYVRPQQIATWTEGLPNEIVRVGVFVNAPPDEIRAAMEVAGLDVVQLHGTESPAEFQNACVRRCWKVVHLNRPLPDDLGDDDVEAFVIDYHSGTQPGGTGHAVDWQAARAFVDRTRQKVVLAGGLNHGTVQAAIQQVRPWGVDVSSGVEKAPGQKDLSKVKGFIEQCRAIE